MMKSTEYKLDLRCANIDCYNFLGEFEQVRISTKSELKYRFCKFCRGSHENMRVKCKLCDTILYSYTNRLFCSNCKHSKRLKYYRNKYRKENPRPIFKHNKLLKLLRTKGITNNQYKEVGIISENSFFNTIKNLRNKGYKIKSTRISYSRYYLEK